MAITTIVFDAYGTLYDVQSVGALAEHLCPGKGDAITQIWRMKQLEYTWLRNAMGAPATFDQVTHESLVFAMRAVGLDGDPHACKLLAAKYLDLSPVPEAMAALSALSGKALAILSNGSAAMLAPLVSASGLGQWIGTVISAEEAGVFKPDPRVYALVQAKLGATADQVLFVSSNGFDVAGAKKFGLRVAHVRRNPQQGGDVAGPASMFAALRGRHEELGFDPDHVVARLTDLAALVA